MSTDSSVSRGSPLPDATAAFVEAAGRLATAAVARGELAEARRMLEGALRAVELGVDVREGRIAFRPTLQRRRELLSAPAEWEWFDADGRPQRRALAAGELGFTLCQTPIVYRLAAARSVRVRFRNGEERKVEGDRLDSATSGDILGRGGAVAEVVVSISPADLCEE